MSELDDNLLLRSVYGPPDEDAPVKVGERIIWRDRRKGTGEYDVLQGTVIYVAQDGKTIHPRTGEVQPYCIVVSPDISQFPRPVWPAQVIGAVSPADE